MKIFISILTLLIGSAAFSAHHQVSEEKTWVDQFVAKDDVQMAAGKFDDRCDEFITCAEASIERSGYVQSDCKKIANDAQDRCAGAAITKSGYVYSDCLALTAGGLCATESIERSGYVYSDCKKVENYRQDRCAAASIKRSGYVYSDCLDL